MELKLSTMCRGSGVAYIEVLARKTCAGNSVQVQAFSEDGVALPLARYDLGAAKGWDDDSVYVTPLLDTKRIVLHFDEISPQGEVVSRIKKYVDRSLLKWISRFNYNIAKGRALAIHDIECDTRFAQVHVRPFVFIPANGTPSEFILKGHVHAPLEGAPIDIRLIDGRGCPVPIPVSTGKQKNVFTDGIEVREVTFTVRIPDDGGTYCVIGSAGDDVREGFLCLNHAMRGSLLETHNPVAMQKGAPGEYAKFVHRRNVMLKDAPSVEASHDDPLMSVVVPLYRTTPQFLNDMVGSVLGQTYPKWELVLVNASPDDDRLAKALDGMDDPRIRVLAVDENKGISANTNVGIDAAKGDWIFLLDHDDVLDPMALEEYARLIAREPDIDAVYSDEDLMGEGGQRFGVHYKSDFNIDLLRCHNYITHFLGVRAPLMKKLMLRSQHDGAQDYDLVLRVVDSGAKIAHVPLPLYHWRAHSESTAQNASSKTYADEAGRSALEEHLKRNNIDATAQLTDRPFFYRAVYRISGSPNVAIIIPNKDHADILARCIDSVESLTTYRNFNIYIVENGSEEKATFDYYEEVQKAFSNVKIITWPEGFNYSAINNFAVKHISDEEYLLFLNNDIEVIEAGWLESMLSVCQRPEVGVVGARLVYPDGTIQHAGIQMKKAQAISDAAGPNCVFLHTDQNDGNYMGRASLRQDVSAVTAACMMTPRKVFEKLGGFDESFVVAFNDVDYCLRVRDADLLVVYEPEALLCHYESLSRGSDGEESGSDNYARFLSEQGLLRARWGSYYAKGDPYYKF